MFVVIDVADTVKILCRNLSAACDLPQKVTSLLNVKYANKLIKDKGLAIRVSALLSVSPAHIYPGEGCAHVKAEFQLLLFTPAAAEILVGKVERCEEAGLHVTLGFFNNVFIPASDLPLPSSYDEVFRGFNWIVNEADGENCFVGVGNVVRFRVTAATYEASGLRVVGSMAEDGLGAHSWWF